jgi:hypothetical protein
MEQDRTESFASPLDEVLENIPQEDPPQDLEQRCLDALGGSTADQPWHPSWWLPVRNVIAVAAALVLVVGAVNVVGPLGGAREKARMDSDAVLTEAPPSPSAPSGPGGMMAEEAAPPPGQEAAAEGIYVDPAPPPATDGLAAREVSAAPEAAGSARTLRIPARRDAGDVIAGAEQQTAYGTPQAPEVEDPWRDFTGDRQVVTTKQLDLEVGDVEEAYDDVRSIVSKHGGFVAGDRVQIAEDRPDEAHLTIRLPVGSFESAITDLRQLGEVTRLVGQSVDVTEQYYEEGAQIREKADREQWLVERIENARTEAQKRQLRQQLEQLRREMKQEKEILTQLAEQTHWPVLELRLTEASGPGDFFSRTLDGSLVALTWMGATAIIWVPLLVLLTLFWRRLTPRPSE